MKYYYKHREVVIIITIFALSKNLFFTLFCGEKIKKENILILII